MIRASRPGLAMWSTPLTPHMSPAAIGCSVVRLRGWPDASKRRPIAVGEVLNSIWDCKSLIEEQLIDYIRMTVAHSGGITHLRRIADLAALYQVRTGCHGPSDLSPVCMAAALHFDMAIPNFGIQEYMGYPPAALDVFQTSYSLADGMMHPGERPGLGIEIDEKLAAKYPYDPAYLPVARLDDGTLWNW